MKIAALKNGFKRMTAKISTACLALVATGAAYANQDAYNFNSMVDNGQSIDDVAENAQNAFSTIFNIIKGLGVLVGLILVFVGVMRLKKSQDQNSGVSPMQGVLLIVFGGLCAVLPWLLITSATTVQG